MTRGLSPAATHQTYPAEKKRRNFTEEQHFRREQRSQQLFSAGFLSSLSQQLFSAALLSSFSQQPFSAALLSSSSQQPFSAALLSSLSHQLFSAALLSYHLAVVRGWWSASNIIFSSSSQQLFSAIILLWSGVGGQLLTSSSAALLSSSSQQLFSAIILLWSGVGGQVCYRSLEGPFRNAFGNCLREMKLFVGGVFCGCCGVCFLCLFLFAWWFCSCLVCFTNCLTPFSFTHKLWSLFLSQWKGTGLACWLTSSCAEFLYVS